MRNQLSLKPFSSNSHHSWWNMQDCDLWIKLIFPNAPIKLKIILMIFRTDLLLSLQVNIVKVKRLTLWHRESVEGKWPTNYAYISLFFATQMFIYIFLLTCAEAWSTGFIIDKSPFLSPHTLLWHCYQSWWKLLPTVLLVTITKFLALTLLFLFSSDNTI